MHNIIDLDTFDLKILALLQSDGRLTNQELSEQVALSASQCSRRRLRLEETGIITSYRALVDAEKVGLSISAFLQVTMAAHSRAIADDFRDLVRRTPSILNAYVLMGQTDYLLSVSTADLKGLAQLVNDVLLPHPSVARVQSQLVLDRLKEGGILPL